jgi:hypothetical protein
MEALPLFPPCSLCYFGVGGGDLLFLSEASLWFMQLRLGGSGANLIKSSTWLNSGKSCEQGEQSNPLCVVHTEPGLFF